MYMIRFLAFYEDRVSHARTTEVNHPAIYSTYRALLERTPRPRNKMTPFRTNYELFSVTIVSSAFHRLSSKLESLVKGPTSTIPREKLRKNV
jgi:hypothetical protein